MYAVAFDLVVADAQEFHPRGISQAYTDIATVLNDWGFSRVQGSLFVSDDENMASLFEALRELCDWPWFPRVVRDIRAFRVEQWSNFTEGVKARVQPDTDNLVAT